MGCLNDNEFKVVREMRRRGGSFVQSLAECFQHADMINKARLKAAFPEYWRQYEQIAGIEPPIEQPKGTLGKQTTVQEHIENKKKTNWDNNLAEQADQDCKEGQFTGDAYLK